jgi:hypothetical protein
LVTDGKPISIDMGLTRMAVGRLGGTPVAYETSNSALFTHDLATMPAAPASSNSRNGMHAWHGGNRPGMNWRTIRHGYSRLQVTRYDSHDALEGSFRD